MTRATTRRSLGFGAAAALLAVEAGVAASQVVPPGAPPGGGVILHVTGAIGQRERQGEEAATFDLAGLEALGLSAMRTRAPSYFGQRSFEGVPVAALLRHLGARGTQVTATAANGHSVRIPISDFERYGVLLATRRDGAPLPLHDKGPLFLLYPFDAHPDLAQHTYYERSIWQVARLHVE